MIVESYLQISHAFLYGSQDKRTDPVNPTLYEQHRGQCVLQDFLFLFNFSVRPRAAGLATV